MVGSDLTGHAQSAGFCVPQHIDRLPVAYVTDVQIATDFLEKCEVALDHLPLGLTMCAHDKTVFGRIYKQILHEIIIEYGFAVV